MKKIFIIITLILIGLFVFLMFKPKKIQIIDLSNISDEIYIICQQYIKNYNLKTEKKITAKEIFVQTKSKLKLKSINLNLMFAKKNKNIYLPVVLEIKNKIKKKIEELKYLKKKLNINIIEKSDKKNISVYLNEVLIFKVTFSLEKTKIVLIIDDCGYSFNILEKIISLPINLNFAVLPKLRYTKKSMKYIKKNNRTVLLHLPLQPLNNKIKLDDTFITEKMTDDQIKNKIDYYIKKYPLIEGMNNHMGSKSTVDKRIMNIICNELKKNKLFFIDSFTNRKSIAYKIALEKKMPTLQNGFFIDNVHKADYVVKRLKLLLKKSRNSKKKINVAIGHNKLSTYLALKKISETENLDDIEFIELKNLLKY